MKEMIPDRRNTLERLIPSVMVVLFGGLLIFILLVSCKQDPMEAKKKRLGEIMKEGIALREQVEANPNLRGDPAMGEKLKKLMEECEPLVKELTGGDKTKEEALTDEILRKYVPEHYDRLMAEKKEAQLFCAESMLRGIQGVLQLYRVQHGAYPTAEEGLRVLIKDDADHTPYLDESMLKDPWGNPVVYKIINPYEYTLKSLGPDGKEDTPDDIEVK